MNARWFTPGKVLLGAGVLAVIALGVVALGRSSPSSAGSDASVDLDDARRVVSVLTASPEAYASEVTGFAEVRPRWLSTLRTEVGGRLVHLSSSAQPGSSVRAGQLLAVVDTTAWVANLSEARNRVAAAELQLLRAEQEAREARRSWEASGLTGDPLSALVLHGPQIAAAEAEVEAARAAETWARQRLDQAQIRAPFDGITTERYVSVGETLGEGEAVISLFATGAFDLELPLSEEQWTHLPDDIEGAVASVHEPGGGVRTRASILRAGSAIDVSTRMRTLYLTVSDPLTADDPLFPGAFVEVRVSGRTIPNLLRLPEGVLTRRGRIWFVDSDGALQSFAATPAFTSEGAIYVPAPEEGRSEWRVVRYPLESYMAGQAVVPTSEDTGG